MGQDALPEPPNPPNPPEPPEPRPCHWHDKITATAHCSVCGWPVCDDCRTPADDGTGPVCPTCAPAVKVAPSVPWEAGPRNFQAFKRTFLMPFNKQSELFRAFPSRPLGRALLFALLAGVPTALAASASTYLQTLIGLGPLSAFDDPQLRQQLGPEFRRILEEWGMWMELGVVALPLASLLFLPLGVLFNALLHHLMAMMVGAKHDLVSTVRVTCYLWPVNVLQAVPFFGPILALAWWVIAMKTAMERMHGMSEGRALLVGLAPILFGMVLACGGCCIGVGIFVAMFS